MPIPHKTWADDNSTPHTFEIFFKLSLKMTDVNTNSLDPFFWSRALVFIRLLFWWPTVVTFGFIGCKLNFYQPWRQIMTWLFAIPTTIAVDLTTISITPSSPLPSPLHPCSPTLSESLADISTLNNNNNTGNNNLSELFPPYIWLLSQNYYNFAHAEEYANDSSISPRLSMGAADTRGNGI